jgi:hypothetical protein
LGAFGSDVNNKRITTCFFVFQAVVQLFADRVTPSIKGGKAKKWQWYYSSI